MTAERREASIQDTSISITAFTGDFLDDFGIRNQEDLQNFIPATTIQPYDATVRGVGRNFRALGGDPGVATYMNGVYSEDLLTATAATFFDVERIEVLRGPQGTLYGRNAVGGAINILYKQPTDEFEAEVKSIVGNMGQAELYGMVSGPIIQDKLSARFTGAFRDRDGIIDDIGPGGGDIDGLGTLNGAIQLRWNPTDTIEVNLRQNQMDIDRSFGGANGGGLVVLNDEGQAFRNTTDFAPGYRPIDPTNTNPANVLQNDFYDTSRPILSFTNPADGTVLQAQRVRLGVDPNIWNGLRNGTASLSGFNQTNAADAARYNDCVFPGTISGSDLCASTNGLNREEFKQRGTQFTASWDVNDRLELKYIYGYNTLMYERTTDDDNSGSLFYDRQFYVNHEANYSSHELQAFFDITDNVSVTSGIFFYDATIDQRGDFYSTVDDPRYLNDFDYDAAPLAVDVTDADGNVLIPAGTSSSFLFGGPQDPIGLFTARQTACGSAAGCPRNATFGVVTAPWYGDDGTDEGRNVDHGPATRASDLLYATKTERDSFAAYTQGVWDINETFTLTLGIRYAEDNLKAEENLWRYQEAGGAAALIGGVGALNLATGGLVDNGDGTFTPTITARQGLPLALSVYRPFERTDKEWTGRVNLDWNVTNDALVYFSATSGYRAGGYNLVFFSQTATYDPEELIAYEIGYKTQWLDGTLQANGSFYLYDYENIHTVGTEVSAAGGTSTSVLEAPGAEIQGIEGEIIWLATEALTIGGNFSYTPSEYTEDLFLSDPSRAETPEDLFPDFGALTENINGNQILQVPELKYTTYASYRFNLEQYGTVDLFGTYSWIDEVFYSPFEREQEKSEAYGRTDLRATWTSTNDRWIVTGFVNNVFDDIGVLQVLRESGEFNFRHTAGITSPRMYGLEFTFRTNP